MLRDWLVRLRSSFASAKADQELESELAAHLDFAIEENLRRGMTPTEARRQALIKFGGIEQAKQHQRDARGFPSLAKLADGMSQDVRYAARMLRKSPGFTAIAILTVALCIGATTAIFSVVNATLLRPLPYPEPDRLVTIQDDLPGVGATDVGMSVPEWQDLQHSGIFENVSPTWYDDNNLTGSSRPARVSLLIVAPGYFSVLGVKPELGQTFDPTNHSPGFTTEVVISDGLWNRLFGRDQNILGRNMRLDTDLYHIIGVMPPDFRPPGTTAKYRNIEVWAATSFYGAPMPDQPPRNVRYMPTAIARLKPGLSLSQAQSKVDGLVAALQKQFPTDYPSQGRWTVRLVPLKDAIVGSVRQPLLLLFAAVALVLIIGCVNIANLLLARASVRGREIGLRKALGASRNRLVVQLLTESILLSGLGGFAGLALLFLTKPLVMRLIPESLPRLNAVSISWGVLLFAFILAAFTGVAFGLVPALQLDRLGLIHILKQEGRASSASGGQARTRHALIVAEFALSLVLMVACGLLLRSFWQLLNVTLGFNPQSVMTVDTRLPYPNVQSNDVYRTPSQKNIFFHELLRRGSTLPGVEEIAIGDLGAIPLGHERNNQTPMVPFVLEGQKTDVEQPALVDESIISPQYFHLMGIALLEGRAFTDFDNEKAPRVAVVNQAMAQAYWPNQDPIGKHLKLPPSADSWTTIVGVVANARTESLEQVQVPQIYTALYQRGARHLAIFLRGSLNPAAIPDQVRREVQAVDASVPVFGARMLSENVTSSLAARRFSMNAVGFFAVIALSLAAIGIYGVISYTVGERAREIAIRLALGAQRSAILHAVLRQGIRLAILGVSIGLACALLVARFMAGVLYGIKPTDLATFAAVPVILAAVALVACMVPARRASNVDPMTTLREG